MIPQQKVTHFIKVLVGGTDVVRTRLETLKEKRKQNGRRESNIICLEEYTDKSSLVSINVAIIN